MKEQYKSLVNWYYIEDWSDYPGPKGRVVPNAEGYDNPSDYDGAELYISQGTIGDKEGNLFIDEEGNDVPFNSEYFEKTNPLKENKMNKETLRMQVLAGIITEGQYKVKLNENMLDEIPLTPEVKAYIDDSIQSAKEDGELEYLTDVGFFDTDIIDNILVEFMDEFPDVDDVSQEVKDYIESQL
jgi:hypothetical protein